jgi:hypothetical protein
MRRIAEFAVETEVETVRSRFLGADIIDEITHPEFRRRSAYGEGVDRLSTRFQILDTRKNDLGSWKLVEPLIEHGSSLDG